MCRGGAQVVTALEHFLEKEQIAGESIASRYPQRALLWDPHRNGSQTPENTCPGSRAKVWWQCEKGHSWQARVSSVVLQNCGCPYCAGKKAISGETDLLSQYPKLAKQWDKKRNGDLDPSAITPASHTKVWWRCEKKHSWQAAPYSRTREKGSGCPYCAGRRVLAGFNDLASQKPGLAEQWYQPLNGTLTPADVTLGSNKKVWWCCEKNHVWQAYVYARTKPNGTDCPICAGVTIQSHTGGSESSPEQQEHAALETITNAILNGSNREQRI